MKAGTKLTFGRYFGVSKKVLDKEGLFNVSLVSDLPLFIDPFHLFYSDKKEYKKLHDEIIHYLVFLRDLSVKNGKQPPTKGQIDAYYRFPEVKQNWFGFTMLGNSGHGLGPKFARQLSSNFQSLFEDFGVQHASKHLEKLTLVADRVGKDNISDFTTNLIHSYLAERTEKFARKQIDKKKLKQYTIKKAHFDYSKQAWMPKSFLLPTFEDDYVLLTPRDLLTKDETWINKEEFIKDFATIPQSAPNAALREQLVSYFRSKLEEHKDTVVNRRGKAVRKITARTRRKAAIDTITEYPITIEIYVKKKEERGADAVKRSEELVSETDNFHENNFVPFAEAVGDHTKPTSYEEAHARALFFKDQIELHDKFKLLYKSNGKPVNEDWVQLMFGFVWYGSKKNVDRHPDNGLGEPDYSISEGADDKALVEFKLASSRTLEQNLLNQMKKYKEVEKTDKGVWVVICFNEKEYRKVEKLLDKHGLAGHPDYIIVDARKNNKTPPSKIRSTT